ncbi:MAG: hypothetical protein NDJ90_05265 [Oligoflexia bacterium]|nr:hypothetical protein [Oligoflexia bacterium]
MSRRALGFQLALVSLSLVLVTGCASIVRKPEINGVKKVAIVSVVADEMVPWTGGQGRIENFGVQTKQRVALQAYKSFAQEFGRLKWEPIALDAVASNDYYKKEFGPQQADSKSNVLAKTASVLGKLHNARYFTPAGLFPILWPSKEDAKAGAKFDFAALKIEAKKDFYGQMADLAKALGVDAVVLVGVDYCYTGATAVLGNGTAKMTAGTWVKAVNPDKQIVVDMPPPEKRCGGDRGESDKTVAMVGGSIGLGKAFATDTLVTAFAEASQRSAKLTVDKIIKAMQE